MQTETAFGADGIDRFTVPLMETKTLFGTLFTLPLRAAQVNPNRSLGVLWDDRRPLVEGFDNCYSYLVRFLQVGSVAGNHYHQAKDEIFHAAAGAFTVVLEDIESKQREEIDLRAEDNTFLYCPRIIAHAVRSASEGAVLITLASHPNLEADSFPYEMA